MGNKSKRTGATDNNKVVSKLYKRVAEMEIALFRAGVTIEALVKLLTQNNIIVESEYYDICVQIAREIMPVSEDMLPTETIIEPSEESDDIEQEIAIEE